MVGVVRVPFKMTWRALMSGTADLGIVTLAKAVVPLWPLAVKLIIVEEAAKFDIVASLVTEVVQPVPQPVVVED